MSLPNRRPNISETIVWQDKEYHITVGFDAHGKVAELFINGLKVGSDTEAALQDGCVVFSLALQNGATVDRLAGSLGREHPDPQAPIQGVGRAASAFGVAVNLAALIQNEEGANIAELYELLENLNFKVAS